MGREMVETDKYYHLIEGDREGPWIYKGAGTGRVFAHLISNLEKPVSLEEIAKISGWKNPKKQMDGFVPEINGWSPYWIEMLRKSGGIYYQMNEREHSKNP